MEAAATADTLGSGTEAVRRKWGWFIALGVGLLVAGGVAGMNLLAATRVSWVYIAVTMLVTGGLQITHAFAVHGWAKRVMPLISGVFYFAAGAVAFLDPILSYPLPGSLALGVFLAMAGVSRMIYGFRIREKAGSNWNIASGVLRLFCGALIVATWPVIGLWLLGAALTFDLIFQGWSYIAFGIFLRKH